jgi:hypothetical protein
VEAELFHDRHGEANSRFSHLCKHTGKLEWAVKKVLLTFICLRRSYIPYDLGHRTSK